MNESRNDAVPGWRRWCPKQPWRRHLLASRCGLICPSGEPFGSLFEAEHRERSYGGHLTYHPLMKLALRASRSELHGPDEGQLEQEWRLARALPVMQWARIALACWSIRSPASCHELCLKGGSVCGARRGGHGSVVAPFAHGCCSRDHIERGQRLDPCCRGAGRVRPLRGGCRRSIDCKLQASYRNWYVDSTRHVTNRFRLCVPSRASVKKNPG